MKRYFIFVAFAACKAAAPATTTVTAPNAPTGLAITAGNTENILTWQAATGSTSYSIQRSQSKGGPYTTVGFTAALTYTDSGLANGTAYFYVVGGLNGTVASASSSEATATPLASAGDPPPPVPTGLTATASATTAEVDLIWTAATGATAYVVFRATTTGGPYTLLVASTSTDFSDTTVVTGTAYFYVVRASAGSEQSADSSEVAATTEGVAPPPAPTGVTAISSSTQVALSWNASAGATGYQVSRASTSGGPYTTIAKPTATSYADKVAVGSYFYVVAATNGAAISVDSSEVEATVSAPTSSGWLVGDGGLMLSINTNGLTTTHATVTSQTLNSLTCIGIHDAWAVGNGGVILYTSDGGASWAVQTSSTQADLHSVSFTSTQHGVAVGDGGVVLLTDDGGAHWNDVSATSADLQAVKLAAGGAGAAVGAAGAFLWTTDSGAHWSAKSSGQSVTLYGVDMNDPGTAAIAVGDNGTALSLTASGATSLSWHTSARLYAARFLPDGSAIAVGAGGAILHGALTAGAATALASPSGEDLYAVMVADDDGESGIIAAGAGGTIAYAPSVNDAFSLRASGTTAAVRSVDDLPGD